MRDPTNPTAMSESSDRPITFGWTDTGRYIAVVWEPVTDDPRTIYPVTAYEAPPPAAWRKEKAMKIRSETRKIERSAAEKARLKAIRAKYQREKPSLADLTARGATVVPLGTYLAVQKLLAELRAARQREGLTLEQVAERAGMDKASLSRLETGKQANPTVDSLFRVATALGKTIGLRLESAPPNGRRRLRKTPV